MTVILLLYHYSETFTVLNPVSRTGLKELASAAPKPEYKTKVKTLTGDTAALNMCCFKHVCDAQISKTKGFQTEQRFRRSQVE